MTNWLLACSFGMELIFAIITFLVALYSFKIYKISYQREPKLLSIGFLSISLSYITWFILNIVALDKLKDSINILQVRNAANLFAFGAYIHMILFLLGLATLAYTTLKKENPKYLVLLLPLAILPVIIGTNGAVLFYSISTIFLLYLALHYILQFREKKNTHLIIMVLSFLLLSIGTGNLIAGITNYTNYIIGHALSFIAYLLILLNLILVLKNGKKKK